jgi:hypothetical protein
MNIGAAFDLVNVKLLLERSHITGLSYDVIEQIKVLLTGRMFYVSKGSKKYVMLDLISGTVQGVYLGTNPMYN